MRKIVVSTVSLVVLAIGATAFYIWKIYGPVHVPETNDREQSSLPEFSLPDGFGISVYADRVPDARAIAFAPGGVIVVSEPSEGQIVALPDLNGDHVADDKIVVRDGLDLPHGIAFRCESEEDCDLYVAETDELSRFSYDAGTMTASGKEKLLDLPTGSRGTHFTRSLLFLPSPDDEKLLISIGSSCNVCEESDNRRAAILVYDIVSGKAGHYATGLRNSVFMELHPVSGEVWATEMGRDSLGDDIPPDEINIIKDQGKYGWPICYGKNVHDTQYDTKTYVRNPCMEPFETPSHIDLQAHSAPLGITFVPEEGWPEGYWYNALVAYHGSWNRSVPTGYKIVRLVTDAQGAYSGTEDFIAGWLRPDGTKIGRPADIKALPGGVLYISDDDAGRIYRVSRTEE